MPAPARLASPEARAAWEVSGWRSLAQLPADVDVDRARLAELHRQARRR